MDAWRRLLSPWLEPPYLFFLVIVIIFIVTLNKSAPEEQAYYVTEYVYVSSFEHINDSESCSSTSSVKTSSGSLRTPSEMRSFDSSHSTSSASLRARAVVTERVEDLKQKHERLKCQRQTDASPWESPISSPPPIHKDQEGKKYTHVADALDEVLVNLAHEQRLKKSKPTVSMNEEWWKAIIDGLFHETGIRYNKAQIKSRLNCLYEKWKAWNKVMNTPGFGWDPMEKTIRANDCNWTSYIKVNPESKRIRASTFPMYKELTAIFNNLDAASLESFTISQNGKTKPKLNGSLPYDSSDGKSSTSSGNSINIAEVPNEINVNGKLPQRRITKSSNSGKVGKESTGSSTLEMEVIKLLVDFIKQKDRTASIRPTIDASVSACIKVLQEMEGVQPTCRSVYKAIEMFQSPAWREAFMAMTVDQRFGWLTNLKCA